MHSKAKGNLGEAIVVAKIIENECAAFTEFGDLSKIDLIIEDKKGKLHKVQVKCYSRDKKKPDVTTLWLTKAGPNYYFKYKKEEVEWFAIVDDQTKKIAWINADWALTTHNKSITLRHVKAKIPNGKESRMFDDFIEFPFNKD
jgi:hypothetical protein